MFKMFQPISGSNDVFLCISGVFDMIIDMTIY